MLVLIFFLNSIINIVLRMRLQEIHEFLII